MIATQGTALIPLHERVAAEVRAFMARRKLTQTALAALLGWKQQYLSRRLTGAVPFDVAELGALSEALDVPVEQFFSSPDVVSTSERIRKTLSSYLRRDLRILRVPCASIGLAA